MHPAHRAQLVTHLRHVAGRQEAAAAQVAREARRVRAGERAQPDDGHAGGRGAVLRHRRATAGDPRLPQRRRHQHLHERVRAFRRCVGHHRAPQLLRQLHPLLHVQTVPQDLQGGLLPSLSGGADQ